MRVILAALGAASVLAMSAHAQSDLLGTRVLGTQLNPSGLIPGIAGDERGMSQLLQYSRTPTGLLYPKPLAYPAMTQSEENSPWWHSAWVEAGFLANLGETRVASFGEYGDWSSGPVISLGFLTENRDSADFFSGRAGSVGRDDQYYELNAGRYGVFDIGLFYDAIPHLLSTNAKILWQHAGSSQLTLPAGMMPGAVTAAEIAAALDKAPQRKLSVMRTKTGLNALYAPFEHWELFLALSSESRDGRQAMGSTFAFPGTRGVAELPQPVQYQTVDMTGGVRFKGEAVQANVTVASSFFRNANTSLTWENPALGLAPGAFVPVRGRIALAPDNDYHAVRGDIAWAPGDLRFAANAAYTIMRQDDPLLPPVANSGLSPVNLANWNTLSALSRNSADAEIRAFDGTALASATPLRDLRVTLQLRYRDEDNRTRYTAFNPATGEYGYVGLDGALSRIYNPSIRGSDVPISNIPFSTDHIELSAKADYRLFARTRLNLGFVHKEAERQHREVSSSNDEVFEAQLSHSAAAWGTARLSYAYADRFGSDYVSDPYLFARSASLPGYLPRAGGDPPYALAPLAKYDVAERREHAFGLKTNIILAQDTDLQFGGTAKLVTYGAEYGLEDAHGFDANVSVTRQLAGAASVSAFYALSARDRTVVSINVARGPGSDTSAGGSNYPLANAWRQDARDANHLLGATLHYVLAPVTLDLNYSVSSASGRLAYVYASASAITPGLTPAQAGSAFPYQTFVSHVLEANVTWPYREKFLVRGTYRLEAERVDDFHYAGVRNVIGNQLYLATVPQNYIAHVLGVFTQWRF